MTHSILLRLVDLIFGFMFVVLGFRVVLKLLGASSQAPFVNWVYETSQPLLTPFQGMFPPSVLTDGFVIEPSTLFALLAYSLVSYAISELIRFINFSTNHYYKQRRDNE